MRKYYPGSAQNKQYVKNTKHMYALTAVKLALCPAAQRELDILLQCLQDEAVPLQDCTDKQILKKIEQM